MKKKIVGIITAMTMLISALSQITVNAAEEVIISTAQELKAFADSVNAGDTYEGKTVLLTQDIELDINEIWSPIGGDFIVTKQEGDTIYKTQCKFSGNFDGQNHTISGMNAGCYETNYGSYQGLFGYVYEGTVKNLTVKGSIQCTDSSKKVMSIGYVGGAVACAEYAEISNVNSYVSITGEASQMYEIGGVVGYACYYTYIDKCTNYGSISVNGTVIGGVVGYMGEITEIVNCVNAGRISSNSAQIYVGGVVGSLKRDSGYVNNCYNYGKLTCNKATLCGGVIGEKYSGIKDSHITNNYYLDTSADDVVEEPQYNGIESKTAEQFASGEVTYLLNGKTSEGNLAWYQNIGEDDFPVLDNTHSVVMSNVWGYCNKSTSPSVTCAYIAQVNPLTNEVRAKVNSYSELTNLFTANSYEYRFLTEKYNEAFFENNYLFIYYIDKGSSGNEYSAPAISESLSGIEIKVNKEYSGDADDIVEWYLLCELDKAFSEKAITVTLTKSGKNVNVEYPYQINGLRITNTAGKVIEKIQNNTSFIVEADITKTGDRNEKDYLFVAVYDTDGALISLDYVKAKFAVDGECSFGFSIPPQEKSVGSVKAFVWNTFNSMEPLAENKTLSFTE